MRRLRSAEWLAVIGAVLLLVALFVLHWYGPQLNGPHRLRGWWTDPPLSHRLYARSLPLLTPTGWQAITTLRWFALVTALLGLGLAFAQAASRGPALPVSLDLVTTLVAGVTTILLAVCLASTGAPLRFGAVVGLFASGLVCFGAFRAMRTEGGWSPGEPRRIEVVQLRGCP